jgi:multidrug efflux system membrane fusion protein
MTRRRRIGIAAAAVVGVFVLYEVTTSYLAYTADAYVESDLVALAPQITGRIVSVHVTDNQNVVQGDLLATIDPVPFQLTVDQRRAEVDEARAQVSADQHVIASAQDALAAAASAARYAHETQTRLATLTKAQDVSQGWNCQTCRRPP